MLTCSIRAVIRSSTLIELPLLVGCRLTVCLLAKMNVINTRISIRLWLPIMG